MAMFLPMMHPRRAFVIGALLLASIFTVSCGSVAVTDTPMKDERDRMISAPFRCDNDSGFVAVFPSSMHQVTITAEGEENVIPMAESSTGKFYENDGWSFLFRGEQATVTDKTMKTTTTCKPPFDPDNAPHNFGD